MGVCGNVCWVAAIVKDMFSLGVLKYVYVRDRYCISVYSETRGAVCARVWEV